MNRKRWLIVGLVVFSMLVCNFGGLFGFLVFGRAWSSKIAFYGIVVDEAGKPIPAATVSFYVNDVAFDVKDRGSKAQTVSDENGRFFLKAKGAGVSVGVKKQGYHVTEQSHGNFGYGVSDGSPTPDEDRKAAVFVLRRIGNLEPLMEIRKSIKAWSKAPSVELSLDNGKVVPEGAGDLRVETWLDSPADERQFGWHCRISTPGGQGVIQRNGGPYDFQFEAPEHGYQARVEVGYKKDDEPYKRQDEREYFAHIRGDRFARFRLYLDAGQSFNIHGYLNPKPGSRNLEAEQEWNR